MRRALLLICLLSVLALPAAAGGIVGGHAPDRPYPHMGALYFGDEFYCGSSLIRAQWVLTAAHCVEGSEASRFSVQLGTAKRSQGGERVAVTEAIVNEDGFDLALLKLAKPVGYAPIRVAGPGDDALYEPGTESIAIGWGATFFVVGGTTDDLQQIEIPVRDETDCQVSTVTTEPYDPRTMVCAGETTGGEDTCQGDSGGPLMVDSGGTLVLIGATSFGTGCAFPTQHGVYARTATATDWINSTAGAPAQPSGSGSGGGPQQPSGGSGSGSGSGGGSQPPGSSSSDQRVQLTLPAAVGSARAARKRGRLEFALRASGPVTDVRVTLKRGRKLLGRGHVARIVGEGVVRPRVKRSQARAGRVSITVTARDGQGRLVKASRRAKLRR